jgi:cell division septum initiation protein DivIVA
MPDENSAATEHAIIQEVTAPLATLPDNPVPAVADVDFPVVLRGYDRLAVDAYVKQTSQLVAELQATRSPESAVRRALERVGEEVSGILQRAHDAASQITAQSRSEAEDRLEVARQEAVQITADARHRLKDLDVETDRIWAERQRIVEDAQDLARQLLALAESAADRFPAAEEPASEQTPASPAGAGQPVPPTAATPAGEERQARADRSVSGGEPGSREDDAEPEGREPGPAPPRAGDETTEPLDGEATMIMPPIKPDEDQQA